MNGKYRGAALRKCNFLMAEQRGSLPVIFHNFRNYDSQLICHHGMNDTSNQLTVIAQIVDKYETLSEKHVVEEYIFEDGEIQQQFEEI